MEVATPFFFELKTIETRNNYGSGSVYMLRRYWPPTW